MNARVDMKINQAELAIAVEKSFAAPNYAPIPVSRSRRRHWLWDADGSAIWTSCRPTLRSVTGTRIRVWSPR